MNLHDFPDTNPDETAEWREAFEALLAAEGPERARYILDQLAHRARAPQVGWAPERGTPYVNTIPAHLGEHCPGNLEYEERLRQERDQARSDLQDRTVIDRAKALLMKHQGLSEDQAFAKLRKVAMDKGLKLGEVAQRTLDMADLLKS